MQTQEEELTPTTIQTYLNRDQSIFFLTATPYPNWKVTILRFLAHVNPIYETLNVVDKVTLTHQKEGFIFSLELDLDILQQVSFVGRMRKLLHCIHPKPMFFFEYQCFESSIFVLRYNAKRDLTLTLNLNWNDMFTS
jgi:hypothetical protein